MRRRASLLVAALVLAVVGTAIVFGSATSREPAEAASAEPQTAVLVATQVVPAGTTGQQAVEQGLIALSDVPDRLVPEGALVDVVAIRDSAASSDLQPGEILLPARFVSTSVAGSLDIPDDKIALSVEVADAQRVAGFVRPGSEVAVFTTYQVTQPEDAAPAEPVVEEATRLLLPRVQVIAVGPTAFRTVGAAPTEESGVDGDSAAGQVDSAAMVTVAVDIAQAQKLAHAAQTGRLTLGLLSEQSRTGTDGADDNRTLFN